MGNGEVQCPQLKSDLVCMHQTTCILTKVSFRLNALAFFYACRRHCYIKASVA